jgi:hypothetical protein
MFSFSASKKVIDFQPKVRRLCDLTTPNLAVIDSGRSENRYNRAVPTVLAPWKDEQVDLSECVFGLTSDLADGGACVILNEPFEADEVVVGYWTSRDDMSEPWYFLGTVRRLQALGGGFWTMGIEFTEFANPNHREALAALSGLAATLPSPATPAVDETAVQPAWA